VIALDGVAVVTGANRRAVFSGIEDLYRGESESRELLESTAIAMAERRT
jgi:hypothetical protein